jgi:uncharacterized membrane protein
MPRSKIHLAFEIGVILKGINGLLELIAGVVLLAMAPGTIQGLVTRLTQNELSEDPRDLIATRLREAAGHLSANVKLFAGVYLLAHGVIKGLLVYGLLRDELWAFPTAITVFGAFAIYQMYRYAITPSGWLIALTALDVAVILLTWAEWRRVKHRVVFVGLGIVSVGLGILRVGVGCR